MRRRIVLPACDVPANAVHPISHPLRTKESQGPETGTRVAGAGIRYGISARSHSECQLLSHPRINVFPVSFSSDIRKRTRREMIRMSEPGHEVLTTSGRKCPPAKPLIA